MCRPRDETGDGKVRRTLPMCLRRAVPSPSLAAEGEVCAQLAVGAPEEGGGELQGDQTPRGEVHHHLAQGKRGDRLGSGPADLRPLSEWGEVKFSYVTV